MKSVGNQIQFADYHEFDFDFRQSENDNICILYLKSLFLLIHHEFFDYI